MRNFNKYMKTSFLTYLLSMLPGIMGCLIGIFGLVKYHILRFLWPLLIGIILCLLVYLLIKRGEKKKIKDLIKKGLLETAKQEYKVAKSYLGGKVYFGETLLFTSYACEVIEYKEIVAAEFCSFYKDNSNCYDRTLRVKLKNGWTKIVCGCSHDEADMLVEKLRKHQHKIKYTYEIMDPDPEERARENLN